MPGGWKIASAWRGAMAVAARYSRDLGSISTFMAGKPRWRNHLHRVCQSAERAQRQRQKASGVTISGENSQGDRKDPQARPIAKPDHWLPPALLLNAISRLANYLDRIKKTGGERHYRSFPRDQPHRAAARGHL